VKLKGLLPLLSLIFIALFFSCTKINEPTELGDDLIPAIDNVNTFDTTLTVQSAFFSYDDSSRNFISEDMALGRINDPVFGATTADMYFNLSSLVYGVSPFLHKDSVVKIDSVVLSLSYQGSYGDTLSSIAVEVSENSDPTFYDSILYRFDHPGFTTSGVLGNKAFSTSQFKDSIRIGLKKDTIKVANVLRIPVNNSLGIKLKDFGAAAGQPYASDSLFRKAFRGLAVKATNTGNALAYFNLSDINNSRLLVYYQFKNGGKTDTSVAAFVHTSYSQANSIRRTAGGEYLAKINQPSSQKLYIQSSPTGSYVGIKIPGLDGFPNKVIHRAELIVYKVPADNPSADNLLTVPNRLMLDHKGPNNSKDSAYIFDNDIQPGLDGSLDFTAFGGVIKKDESYRFNITRYVQGIITRKERNDSFRLFAPLRSNVYSKSLAQVITVPSLDFIAKGRVVIANNNYPDSTKRLRLRIIYSNL
jgi:hypothetical protein